jgi:hypothetical protein
MKSWKDITLRQAQELFALDPLDFIEDLQFEIEQLSILIDVDPSEIENWPSQKIIDSFKEYEFVKTLPKQQLTEEFVIEETTYKMTPLNELTLAQMVDIEELINLGIKQNIHRIISVIWLPIDKPYEPDPKREELMLDVNLEVIYGNLLFFYHIVTIYINNTQVSLMEMMTEEMTATMMKTKPKQSQTLMQTEKSL